MKYQGIKKLYYSISEISEMLDIKQSVIRYWESEFKELSPQKNRAGNRIFKKDDIGILRMIDHYVHEKHLSINDTKDMIRHLKTEGLFKRKLNELSKQAFPSAEEKAVETNKEETPPEPEILVSAGTEPLILPAEEEFNGSTEEMKAPVVYPEEDETLRSDVRDLLKKISGNIREIIDILNEGKDL